MPVSVAYVYGKEIAACGHFRMIEQPAELAAIVEAVMAETRG